MVENRDPIGLNLPRWAVVRSVQEQSDEETQSLQVTKLGLMQGAAASWALEQHWAQEQDWARVLSAVA